MPTHAEPSSRRVGAFVEPQDIARGSGVLRARGYDAAEAEALRAALGYARDFLARAHPRLGRAGPVCPFISGAVRGNFLRLAASSLDEGDVDALPDLADRLFDIFDTHVTGLGDANAKLFASLIVIFPRLRSGSGFAAIERAQAAAKPAFVERGYMIGEFFPGNRKPGLHNPHFHPLDAPFASLAMRRMTISDAPFMLGDENYRSAFVRHFGEDGAACLAQAQAQRDARADVVETAGNPATRRVASARR